MPGGHKRATPSPRARRKARTAATDMSEISDAIAMLARSMAALMPRAQQPTPQPHVPNAATPDKCKLEMSASEFRRGVVQ